MDLRLCHRPLRLFPRPLRLSLQVPGLVLALKTIAVIQPRTVESREIHPTRIYRPWSTRDRSPDTNPGGISCPHLHPPQQMHLVSLAEPAVGRYGCICFSECTCVGSPVVGTAATFAWSCDTVSRKTCAKSDTMPTRSARQPSQFCAPPVGEHWQRREKESSEAPNTPHGSEAHVERRGGKTETPKSLGWARPSLCKAKDVLAQLRALRASASRMTEVSPSDACVPLETSFGIVPVLQTELKASRTRPRWTDTKALLAEMRQKREEGHVLYTRARLDERKTPDRRGADELQEGQWDDDRHAQPRMETLKPYSRASSTAEMRVKQMRRLSDVGRRLCRVQSSPEAR